MRRVSSAKMEVGGDVIAAIASHMSSQGNTATVGGRAEHMRVHIDVP